MERTFIDTSFLYALAMQQDPNHDRAVEAHDHLSGEMTTSIFVVAETMSLVTKRRGKPLAIEVARELIAAGRTRIIYPDRDNVQSAWRLFAQYPHWDFDLVDAISFALMKREQIETALTFDAHFAQIGFTALPG